MSRFSAGPVVSFGEQFSFTILNGSQQVMSRERYDDQPAAEAAQTELLGNLNEYDDALTSLEAARAV